MPTSPRMIASVQAALQTLGDTRERTLALVAGLDDRQLAASTRRS